MITIIEINFDVDKYLSNGGLLRDLALPSGAELKRIERLAASSSELHVKRPTYRGLHDDSIALAIRIVAMSVLGVLIVSL